MIASEYKRHFGAGFALILLLANIVSGQLEATQPPDTPEVLQQRGIERIDAYKRRFYQTGDQTALLPELEKAATELTASYTSFLARRDFAAAALSQIKLGDIERAQAVVRSCNDCKVV